MHWIGSNYRNWIAAVTDKYASLRYVHLLKYYRTCFCRSIADDLEYISYTDTLGRVIRSLLHIYWLSAPLFVANISWLEYILWKHVRF